MGPNDGWMIVGWCFQWISDCQLYKFLLTKNPCACNQLQTKPSQGDFAKTVSHCIVQLLREFFKNRLACSIKMRPFKDFHLQHTLAAGPNLPLNTSFPLHLCKVHVCPSHHGSGHGRKQTVSTTKNHPQKKDVQKNQRSESKIKGENAQSPIPRAKQPSQASPSSSCRRLKQYSRRLFMQRRYSPYLDVTYLAWYKVVPHK